jgi:hypothetical protein
VISQLWGKLKSDVTGLDGIRTLEAVFQVQTAPEMYSKMGHLIKYILPLIIVLDTSGPPLLRTCAMLILKCYSIYCRNKHLCAALGLFILGLGDFYNMYVFTKKKYISTFI